VVDFIDMEQRKSRKAVIAALEQELKRDRSPSKVLSINEFGLAIITRKRVKQSLERTLCQSCPYCAGSGMIKSVTTVHLGDLRRGAQAGRRHAWTGAPAAGESGSRARAVGRRGRRAQDLAELTGGSIGVQVDPLLHQEQVRHRPPLKNPNRSGASPLASARRNHSGKRPP
jgi:ribonuclease G